MESVQDTGPSQGARPPRRKATVMVADIVGYSRKIEQDEEQNLAQVIRSFELFRGLAGEYGGEIANVSGDGILALFPDPPKAVAFALSVQKEFRDQAVWVTGDPIQFRLGIADGEILENFGTFQGHCINLAARLQTMAEPGGIVVTGAIAEAVSDAPGMRCRSLGRPTLKNLARQIEVFAVDPHQNGVRAAPSRQSPMLEPAGQPSVAVLPLTNLLGEPGMDHLAEGIGASVIDNLSRFRNLIVIAQHSAFMFSLRTHQARAIGEQLGVRYLLGGSVRRVGDRLRIGVELIRAETEAVVWSDRFDVRLEQLFEVQEEIAGSVASRLALQIDMAHLGAEDHNDPHDARAYGLVLRSQQLIQAHRRETNAHARRLLQEALQIAPTYGRAYSTMSRTHNLDWRYHWSLTPDQSLDAALDLAERAVQYDSLDARGHAERGFAQLYRKQHDQSLAHYTRALSLNPNDADIVAEFADALSYAGEPERSLDLMNKAMRLNPYYPDWYLWCLADAYNALGRSADVVATVRQMQNPGEGSRLLAANHAHLGQMDEARAAAREVMRLHPDFTIAQWRFRPPYRNPEVLEHFVEGLRLAGLPPE